MTDLPHMSSFQRQRNPLTTNNNMIYTRFILGAVVLLIIIYYLMVVGQLFGVWKITDREIKFINLVIPFYYWMV